MAVIILFDAQIDTNVASGSPLSQRRCVSFDTGPLSLSAPAFWPEMLHAALVLFGAWD